jgi:hypothetical protein
MNAMLISELIEKLKEIAEQIGDVAVCIDDADTAWHLNISAVEICTPLLAEQDAYATIGGDYGDVVE